VFSLLPSAARHLFFNFSDYIRCFNFILKGWGAIVNPDCGIVVGRGSPSGMLTENSWRKVAKKRNRTLFESDSPTQYLFPLPKLIIHSSFTNLPLESRNRSGRKTSGSPQWWGSDSTLQRLMRTVVSCNNEANMSAIRKISGKFNGSWNEKDKDEWHFVPQKHNYNTVVLRDVAIAVCQQIWDHDYRTINRMKCQHV